MSTQIAATLPITLPRLHNPFTGRCLLLFFLGHFVMTVGSDPSPTINPCSVISGYFTTGISISASPCDTVIDQAVFQHITGGAVYFWVTYRALTVTTSIFDDCENTFEGGGLFAYCRPLYLNRTCFSHCYSERTGMHIRATVYAGTAWSSDCSFYASYPLGETFANSTGDGVRVFASLRLMFYFRNENHSRGDALSLDSAAVDCDSSSCVVNRRFSSFMNCTGDYVLWISSPEDSAHRIQYTNFIANTLYDGVIRTSEAACPVSHCVFAGNQADATFVGNETDFLLQDCVFDAEPIGSWSITGTGNVFGSLTATFAISIIPCVPTISRSPRPSVTSPATRTEAATPPPTEQASATSSEEMTRTASQQRTPADSADSGGVNVAAIVVPIVVVVLGVVVAIGVWWWRRRRSRMNDNRNIYERIDGCDSAEPAT
jgi:hypothetical protein